MKAKNFAKLETLVKEAMDANLRNAVLETIIEKLQKENDLLRSKLAK